MMAGTFAGTVELDGRGTVRVLCNAYIDWTDYTINTQRLGIDFDTTGDKQLRLHSTESRRMAGTFCLS